MQDELGAVGGGRPAVVGEQVGGDEREAVARVDAGGGDGVARTSGSRASERTVVRTS